MKYLGMPLGMWLLYKKSFSKQLQLVIGLSSKETKEVTKKAKVTYKGIINKLPEFEKSDRFKMNIVNCALLSAFYLNLKYKPSLDIMTKYYHDSMETKATVWFIKKMAKKKFSEADYKLNERTEIFRAADRNAYSWNMTFHPYPDGSGYECRFYKCGICRLMNELGIKEIIPAMCKLDYAMSEWGNVSTFIRKYTLASGGPYCDCGYKKK